MITPFWKSSFLEKNAVLKKKKQSSRKSRTRVCIICKTQYDAFIDICMWIKANTEDGKAAVVRNSSLQQIIKERSN